MTSLFSFTMCLQVLFVYISIWTSVHQCFETAVLADGSFGLGFNVDFVSDIAIAQTASVSSDIGTDIQAYGSVGIGDAAAGELSILGTGLAAGQVPLFGAARFEEGLSAAESAFFNVESGFENIDGAEIMYLFGD